MHLSANSFFMQGHCEELQCLDAKHTIFLPQFQPFLPHSFSEICQDLQVLFLINHLTLRYPFSHYYTFYVEENSHLCLHLWLARSCFFHSLWSGWKWHNIITAHLIRHLETFCQSYLNFTRNFKFIHCSSFIPVTSATEQDNTVTLKQSSEANQLV
jgi:hypothetical protein